MYVQAIYLHEVLVEKLITLQEVEKFPVMHTVIAMRNSSFLKVSSFTADPA
jgi:hypothetical protein